MSTPTLWRSSTRRTSFPVFRETGGHAALEGRAPKRYSISSRKGKNVLRPAGGPRRRLPPEAKKCLRFQRFHTHIFTANADCPPHTFENASHTQLIAYIHTIVEKRFKPSSPQRLTTSGRRTDGSG
eukprot:6164389-Prymnesium_polylepis.1